MSHTRVVLVLLTFDLLIHISTAQDRCADAPEEGIREMCRQIQKWDRDSRTVPTSTVSMVRPPGFQGLASGPIPLPSRPTHEYECMDLDCVCGFFNGIMSGSTCRVNNGQMTKSYRKEYRQMTDDERSRYHTAMWAIKTSGAYRTLSIIHAFFQTSPGAHSGPAFLPWHREYLKRLEFALRKVDPTVSLPYWDSTMDGVIPDPKDSIMFGDELMGYPSTDFSMRSGAFANWMHDDGTRTFQRNIGDRASPYQEYHITSAMAFTNISNILAHTAPRAGCPITATWSAIEYTHGSPHVFMGGDMLITANSTNDPIFFQHHTFVDLIWEQWRQLRQTRAQRESDYPEDNELCSSRAHFGSTTMTPFYPLTNRDGLSNAYADNLVSYAPRPSCTATRDDCNSRFLFCDRSHQSPRCAAKIRIGGNCAGYTRGESMCYEGECRNNRCQATSTTTTTTTVGTTYPTQQTTTTTTTTTTSPTTTRFIPSTVPPETCFNDHYCCGVWSAVGECSNNPGYMTIFCKASCNQCALNYDLNIECSNRSPECSTTTRSCSTDWMMENCRQRCGLCGQTRRQQCQAPTTTSAPATTVRTTTTSRPTTTTTAPSQDVTCWNMHFCCEAWAVSGYCTLQSYVTYMKQYCSPSCSSCGVSRPHNLYKGPPCVDLHPSCAKWASTGECVANSSYMKENCKVSCGECALLTLNNRMVACGMRQSAVPVRDTGYGNYGYGYGYGYGVTRYNRPPQVSPRPFLVVLNSINRM